ETEVTSILAGIINAVTPLMAVLAILLIGRDEQPKQSQLIGLAIGFVGVGTVMGIWQGFGDNPIFYVQYAHTRCCSVIRNLQNEHSEFYHKIFENDQINTKNISSILENLTDQNEINLIKKIANYIRVIEMAVFNYEPHRIAFYLQDLSAEFHSLWNKGVENPNLKFILVDDFFKTYARILLINSVKKIIANGLEIFNIKALEYMK
ncbi:MAG: DALR anticodon-binding domain-containing protein, partial [Alphaproteobacteria bacterium]